MAQKKVVRYLTGKVDIKATLSQLRNPAEAKLHSRGPRQIGQVKRDISVRVGKVSRDQSGSMLQKQSLPPERSRQH